MNVRVAKKGGRKALLLQRREKERKEIDTMAARRADRRGRKDKL